MIRAAMVAGVLWCIAAAPAGTDAPARHMPLIRIFLDRGPEPFSMVKKIAEEQAAQQWEIDRGPLYKSTPILNANPNRIVDQVIFEGVFIPRSNSSKLAIFSDDGCNVWIDGKQVLFNYRKGQHLPNITQSLHPLKAGFEAGKEYSIRVRYGNTIFNGPKDIDGCTLFAYDGGGEVKAKVPQAVIVPDDKQQGVTGDLVPSTKGAKGEKHYVSPKEAKGFVVLKAVLTPPGGFAKNFEWEGGQEVKGKPDRRQVSRNAPGKTVVKIKRKGTNQVADLMNVWIVWATIQTTRIDNIVVAEAQVQPKVGKVQQGTYAVSLWSFVATILPPSIIEVDKDVPNLQGKKTQSVPGADLKYIITGDPLKEGASHRWDMSRQIRIRFKDPAIPTNDFSKVGGKVFDGLPNKDKVVIEYPPPDSAIGNDDVTATDEDDDPYSNAEVIPGTKTKLPKGKIGTLDQPILPSFIDKTGKNGDTLEMNVQFGEFVRLQIGDKSDKGYRNWYRISDFALWRHVARFKKAKGTWVDNGSVADKTNDDWK